MSTFLTYTSPARGHIFPLVPTLFELQSRGHTVVTRTISHEVDRLRQEGLSCEPISPEVEAREIDDWTARTPIGALRKALRTFVDRAPHEVVDLREAVQRHQPDALFVDINSWGAMAFAESSGLPWAAFSPYFLPIKGPGVPPWGLGLRPRDDFFGRLRDRVLWWLLTRLFDSSLPEFNYLRGELGLEPLEHAIEWGSLPPNLIYYTAEPFEYPRSWRAGVQLVGPGIWEPAIQSVTPIEDGRPLVLVTCSTEFQNDRRLIELALEATREMPVRVVVTTAALDPDSFEPSTNSVLERFLPHGPILEQAACVVCHGGMGISQKALAAGVPLCVVPFGRDQLETGRHVEVAGAGVSIAPQFLTAGRLWRGIETAMSRKEGAETIARAFARAGGPGRAADILEGLVPEAQLTSV